jgi:adenine-specific DNA-methyltransferase
MHSGSAIVDSQELRKVRGAFFTPPELCRYMAEWAIRTPADRVLEPSCGEAAFLLAAAERLAELGPAQAGGLRTVELHEPSARAAQALLQAGGFDARVDVGDFFAVQPEPKFDAVIGNPPYVRYQDFSGDDRTRARAAALQAGVRLSALASSWAAFAVHATLFLRPSGRLALVLPAELLSTNYAGEVRSFLMRRFARVRLVLFTERVFPGVLEEVVLLLAEGDGPTDHCELHQFRDAQQLAGNTRTVSSWRPTDPEGKWTPALLDPGALAVYREVAEHENFTMLQAWGETTLGAVTGNNSYFALTDSRVAHLGLRPDDLLPLSPPGSRHLRRLAFRQSDWESLRPKGGRVWLFRPAREPSPAAWAYIAHGEREGVDRAYKCRVRDPWWRTPIVPPPDLFVTYMNADTPRLAINGAGVHHLNSVHGLYLQPQLRPEVAELLPIASLNSMTLVGAETVGRAYGGGMLKLEPREADLLPIPAPQLVERLGRELSALGAQVVEALSSGSLREAVRCVDDVLLRDGLGLTRAKCEALEKAHAALSARRTSRGRRGALSETT